MAQVVIGAISDKLGLASSWETVESRHHGRSFDVRRTHWACPSDKFAELQPADLALEAGHHGPRIGTVEHIERSRGGTLWIVGQVDDGWDLTREDWQLSYDLNEKPDGYRLNAVAVVPKSATICLPQLEIRDGALHQAARHVVYQDGATGELIRHAAETQRTRRGESLLIRDIE